MAKLIDTIEETVLGRGNRLSTDSATATRALPTNSQPLPPAPTTGDASTQSWADIIFIYGTEGDDFIEGAGGPQVIEGLGGNDITYGPAGGASFISGGAGNGDLVGYGGNNTLSGGTAMIDSLS